MKNLKAFYEQRNQKISEMNRLLEKVKTETRAFTVEEEREYNNLKSEIESMDRTVEALENERSLDKLEIMDNDERETDETREIRAFAEYIRTKETRAENFGKGDNGVLIPITIAQKVIQKVCDICPIFEKSTVYNVKGKLRIPVYDDENGNIPVGFQEEFTELTGGAGKFVSVDLDGFLVGSLTLVGKSLLAGSDIDLVDFVTNKMAENISLFIEKVLLVGNGQCKGATSTTNIYTAPTTTAITGDDLIELQAAVKQSYQADACWIMNNKTFTAIKKLKDSNDRYLLQYDIANAFPYSLFGKPVYLSDNMDDIETGKIPVIYGNLSGIAVNFRNMEMNMLFEKYATMHAVGLNAWFEIDSKVAETQKIAVLKMAGE